MDGQRHVPGKKLQKHLEDERNALLELGLGNGTIADFAEQPAAEGGCQVHGAVVVPGLDAEVVEKRPHDEVVNAIKRDYGNGGELDEGFAT